MTIEIASRVKWIALTVSILPALAGCDQLLGPEIVREGQAFEIQKTKLTAYRRSPAWINNRLVAYIDESMNLVTFDTESMTSKTRVINAGSMCSDGEGTVRTMARPVPGADSDYIEVTASDVRRTPAETFDYSSQYLSLVACRVVQRESELPSGIPLPGPGRLWISNAIIANNPEEKKVVSEDLVPVFEQEISGSAARVQYLPWASRIDIYTSTGRFGTGDLDFIRYQLDPERDTLVKEQVPYPALAVTQSHLSTRAGVLMFSQKFDRSGDPVLAGLFLPGKRPGQLLAVIEGELEFPAVSPDGCKVATVHRATRWKGRGERPSFTLTIADTCK